MASHAATGSSPAQWFRAQLYLPGTRGPLEITVNNEIRCDAIALSHTSRNFYFSLYQIACGCFLFSRGASAHYSLLIGHNCGIKIAFMLMPGLPGKELRFEVHLMGLHAGAKRCNNNPSLMSSSPVSRWDSSGSRESSLASRLSAR